MTDTDIRFRNDHDEVKVLSKVNEKRETEMKPQRPQRKTLCALWFILTLPK